MVRELLNHGANLNIAANNGDTPLHIARLEWHAEVLRELLNHAVGVITIDEGFTFNTQQVRTGMSRWCESC